MSFSGEFRPQIGNRLYTLLVAGEPKHPEETYKDTRRTCKLHRERPHQPQGSSPTPSASRQEHKQLLKMKNMMGVIRFCLLVLVLRNGDCSKMSICKLLHKRRNICIGALEKMCRHKNKEVTIRHRTIKAICWQQPVNSINSSLWDVKYPHATEKP